MTLDQLGHLSDRFPGYNAIINQYNHPPVLKPSSHIDANSLALDRRKNNRGNR